MEESTIIRLFNMFIDRLDNIQKNIDFCRDFIEFKIENTLGLVYGKGWGYNFKIEKNYSMIDNISSKYILIDVKTKVAKKYISLNRTYFINDEKIANLYSNIDDYYHNWSIIFKYRNIDIDLIFFDDVKEGNILTLMLKINNNNYSTHGILDFVLLILKEMYQYDEIDIDVIKLYAIDYRLHEIVSLLLISNPNIDSVANVIKLYYSNFTVAMKHNFNKYIEEIESLQTEHAVDILQKLYEDENG